MAPFPNFLCSGDTVGDDAENQAGNPRSSPPSPMRSPQWSPLRLSRSIPADMRITHLNALSTTPSTTLVATEDPLCTVGAPTAPDDLIPADTFPGWARTLRSHMSFDGPGGLPTLYSSNF